MCYIGIKQYQWQHSPLALPPTVPAHIPSGGGSCGCWSCPLPNAIPTPACIESVWYAELVEGWGVYADRKSEAWRLSKMPWLGQLLCDSCPYITLPNLGEIRKSEKHFSHSSLMTNVYVRKRGGVSTTPTLTTNDGWKEITYCHWSPKWGEGG